MNTFNFNDHYRTEQQNTAVDAEWLQKIRNDALENFLIDGFPTTKQENWKYTDLNAIVKQAWKTSSKSSTEVFDTSFMSTLPYPHLVFINGFFVEKLSSAKKITDGMIITNLADAVKRYPQQVQSQLGKTLEDPSNNFAKFNTAFLQDGAYIHLAANTTTTEPVHLIFISTQEAENTLINLRNLFVIEKNSKATIIETYISLQETPCFTNVISEAILDTDAELTHFKVLQENQKTYHIGTLQVQQHQNSSLNAHSFTLGGLLVRSDTNVELAAEHAHCTLNGLYLAHGKQHIDHHTVINHAKAHGTSREYYKGVLAGRSRVVFNGKVIVALDAQKTDAQQTNKNLLLSPDAEIDTKPQLEILADDVQCAHGAAVGQLDNDLLFYLRSRGLSEKEARSLLIYAFIRELIERIPLAPLRDYLQNHLTKQLPVELTIGNIL